jgi:nitrate reductase assembly molybdenum cofactor insertion protein NarJ
VTNGADVSPLRARGVAYALLARLLGRDHTALIDAEAREATRTALGAAGATAALARVADAPIVTDSHALAATWVRWFDLGRVAPYEASNVAASAGGITPRLADVAGFYRAFGLAAHGDRPDHVLAQLEFLSVAVMAEAEARERGDATDAAVCDRSVRAFVRDHAGTWIDAWANRVAEVADLAPWAPWAAAAAELVRVEAVARNVIPLRSPVVLPADAGVAADDDGATTCGDEPALVWDGPELERSRLAAGDRVPTMTGRDQARS